MMKMSSYLRYVYKYRSEVRETTVPKVDSRTGKEIFLSNRFGKGSLF